MTAGFVWRQSLSLANGTRLGPYEIATQIGAGGMGEVYRATDTRLDRTVAIKVLPEHLASDPQRRERFEREAKAVSSLNHPHICTLHDVGEQDGVHYLVMELVEGDTLQQRLEKGRLPLDQALEYAIQIADALDKAHRQGVVHRDLKPGNIMITKSAGVKLLDFGLAKLKGDDAQVSPLSQMPTEDPSAPLTAEGTIIGTLQYMAPEQLEGKEADARTDIFAFGAVVYEMVTGKKAFVGASQASLISAIMSADPKTMAELQSMTPLSLDHIVTRCLDKDPDVRWQTAADLMRELKWVTDGSAQVGTASVETPSKGREITYWSAIGVLLISTAVLALAYFSVAPQGQMAFRVSFAQPPGALGDVLAISPDGERIGFLAPGADGDQAVWIRELASGDMRMLAGTQGATRHLFWSPTGESIAFFTQTALRIADLSGTAPRTVCAVGRPGGGTWNAEGDIVFADFGLHRVSELGGQPVPLEALGRAPYFLPDGIHFLYTFSPPDVDSSIYVASLDSAETRLLMNVDRGAKAVYASDHVLFVSGGVLMAQPFDLDRLDLTGEARPIGPQVSSPGVGGARPDDTPFSASTNGILAFRSGNRVDGQLVWFDREGNETRRVPQPQTGEYLNPSISPDGQQIAANRKDPATGNVDIWLIDVGRDTPSPLTSAASFDADPVWSPGGDEIAFSSYRNGKWGLWKKNIGAGHEDLLWEAAEGTSLIAMDWSRNGEFILFDQGGDVWVLPVSGDDPWPILNNPSSSERAAHFSPDGEWVAYSSAEAGGDSIYVARFPDASDRRRVSDGQGESHPRWSSDGGELFYKSGGGGAPLMAVQVDAAPSGLEFGRPEPVFDSTTLGMLDRRHHFAVTGDGNSFLLRRPSLDPPPVTVILNWTAELDNQ